MPSALRAAAAEARCLLRRPLPTLYALAARSSLPLGRVLLRLVADADVLPTTKESTAMEKSQSINPLTLDMNGNGTPDYQELKSRVRQVAQEPEFIQKLAREVVAEMKRHPHTLFSRALQKVKDAAAWLTL